MFGTRFLAVGGEIESTCVLEYPIYLAACSVAKAELQERHLLLIETLKQAFGRYRLRDQ